MIKAKPKPIGEIINELEKYEKVLIAGCNGCVTVCEAGGIKEVELLASALRMYFTKEGARKEIDEASLTRQCDKEYIQELQDRIDRYDVVLSLACGAGVQFKFNAALGFKQAARLMVQSGYCGSYLALVEPGTVCAGDAIELLPGPREVNLRELFRARAPSGTAVP